MAHKQIYDSDKYVNEHYEHRMSCYPENFPKKVPKTHLISEGVEETAYWVHYMIHEPEPRSLLFRQPLPKKQLE
ncbi:cyclin-dependent kinases regulatory subunit 2-like [Tenrec ecaudatus]|uniref:cyclin-dependent kinases regulatory subunit 2-like n=1 Tax=Tenrec ecaudatus TaxID=94439 RepID=UPI003F59F0FB